MISAIFRHIPALLILLAFAMSGPLPVSAQKGQAPGDLVSHRLLGEYSKQAIDSIMSSDKLKGLLAKVRDRSLLPGPAGNAVKAWLVIYRTTGTDGSPVNASGLLLVPDPASERYPLISYQHGTVFKRNEAPSGLSSSGEAVFNLAVFAAHGYVVSLPDYIGQGHSKLSQPYLIAESEASASLDMLKASRALCSKLGAGLNGKLFLAGYSQGGHSTMALHRMLEKDHRSDFPVTASAPMAGPYNLYMLWSGWIDEPSFLSSAVMARTVLACDDAYSMKLRLRDVFRTPYDRLAPVLLDGNHSDGEVIQSLPRNPSNLFTSDFLKSVSEGRHPFYMALKRNSTFDWYPEAPTTLFHGSSDDIVPYAISLKTYRSMKRKCDNVELRDVGPLDHIGAIIPCMLEARKWFDSFR